MKTDLDQLIELLEEEKASLEKSIAEYVEEDDYLYASYHQKALWQVNAKLERIYGLKIPHYGEILMQRNRISYYKKEKNTLKDYFAKKIEREIEEKEKEIEDLNKNLKTPSFHDSQIIDDALFDLVEHKLKGFQLCFSEEQAICIEFKLGDDFIEIALPPDLYLSEHDPEDEYNYQHLRIFTELGFEPDENNRLIYKYPLHKFRDAIEIKILLSHLLYDVFYYYDKWNSARLIYL